MENKQEEKWALITGSGGGIAGALLEKFASKGYCLYAQARKDTPQLQERLSQLRNEYCVKVEPLFFDLTDSESVKETMQQMIRERKQVDVLVNNAGMMHAGLFQMTEIDTIRQIFDVNLFGAMELTQWVLKLMVRKKRGSIVNILSIAALDLGVGQCAYGTSKAAVAAFTRTLAEEMGNYGIRVNAVAPGFTDTPMASRPELSRERELLESGKGKFSRLAQPREVAEAVYFLASEEASFVNGQILRVDGGNRCKL